MPNRVANVLESYDFFGKSMPGIVFILGIVSLLPGLPLTGQIESTGTLNFAVLTALAVTLVFAGLVTGQAVHTIADNIEKGLFRIGTKVHNWYYLYTDRLPNSDWLDNKWENSESVRPWIIRRYWGINDVFKSHRRLFENEIGWYFDISKEARRSDTENISLDYFRDCCKEALGIDIARFEQTEETGIEVKGYPALRRLYPMVTGRTSSTGRANGFQARYSFCRGMWVVLFIMIVLYLGVLFSPFSPQALQYQPLILRILTEPELGFGLWVMFFLGIAFMDASGDYKWHYIEYLVADFCTAVGPLEDRGRGKQGKDKE